MKIKTAGQENKVHLGLRVPPELRARVLAVAAAARITLSAAAEQLLAWALDRHEREVARRNR